MKFLKFMTALCLIATVTVISLSSFTGKSESPVKKTTIDGAFFLPASGDASSIANWDDFQTVECSEGSKYCSFSYTTEDESVTDQMVLNALLTLHPIGSAVSGSYPLNVNGGTANVQVTVQTRTTD